MSAACRLLEALDRQVRVDLSGREIRVAQELLHATKVSPSGEKLGGKGVTHGVWGHR